eukprot:409286-Prymnesium_polylepis.1
MAPDTARAAPGGVHARRLPRARGAVGWRAARRGRVHGAWHGAGARLRRRLGAWAARRRRRAWRGDGVLLRQADAHVG